MSQSGEMHNSKVGWALNDYVDATYYPRVVNEYGEYDNDAKQQLKDDDLIWSKTRIQGECMHIQQLSPWVVTIMRSHTLLKDQENKPLSVLKTHKKASGMYA